MMNQTCSRPTCTNQPLNGMQICESCREASRVREIEKANARHTPEAIAARDARYARAIQSPSYYVVKQLGGRRMQANCNLNVGDEAAAIAHAEVVVREWRKHGYRGGCELVRNGDASVVVFSRA